MLQDYREERGNGHEENLMTQNRSENKTDSEVTRSKKKMQAIREGIGILNRLIRQFSEIEAQEQDHKKGGILT